MDWMRFALGGAAAALIGCGPAVSAVPCESDADCGDGQTCNADDVCVDDDSGSSGGSTTGLPTTTSTNSTGSTTTPGTTTFPDTTTGTTTSTGTSTGEIPACEGPGCQVDLLFVIDNSGTMAEEQAHIGRAMAGLEADLRARQLDVQVMFTTVDFGNPLCTPFEPDGYDPARGAPVDTSCTDRLADFTGLGLNPVSVPEACTDVCPTSAAPVDDPFVAFDPNGGNGPDVDEVDIDGDGLVDTPTAMAMACLAPQGINGCGYESPLENMLQALNPAAAWNQGGRPFVRDGAALAIAIVTDEADCSISDFSVMEDETYQEINPDTSMPAPSSAICWNAGVTCTGPNMQGIYSDCASADSGPLQPLTRYTNFLITELRQNQGKEVVMLGLVGVPPVTQHAADGPFEPEAGGVFDLVYRDWVDGQYPTGDILPDEFNAGVTAADKQFDFGIGPGCTAVDEMSTATGQAIPPVRLREVCESLDLGTDGENLRCCLESVCDSDYTAAMQCLVGLIDNVAG